MSRERYVYDKAAGKFVPAAGHVAPELLPPELRSLPGEAVTKDPLVADKVHALDPDYIRENILEERREAETPPPPAPEDMRKEMTHKVRFLTQDEIDIVRARVILTMISEAQRAVQKGRPFDHYFDVKHIWFPENNIDKYELRTGNPPAGADRPKHLKTFALAIDPLDWPARVRKILDFHGFQCPTKAQFKEWQKDFALSAISELNEQRSEPTVH